jgi:hypothetical protein
MKRRSRNARSFVRATPACAGVESLERRVLFATMTFQIDPGRSQLTAKIAINSSTSSVPQGANSLTTSFQGTLLADAETDSVSFPGGSSIVAQTTGNWQPGGTPADYGGQATILGSTAFGAVRDLSFDVSSAPLPLASDGTFSSGQDTLKILIGTISFSVPAFNALETETFANATATNTASNSSRLTATTTPAGLLETLSIPIDVVYPFSAVSNADSQLEFTGTIVATASIVATPPVINLDGVLGSSFAASFEQGSGPVPLEDPDAATISDNTQRPLVSATVTLTNALDGANETLSANTAGTNISAVFNPGSETLQLSGNASLQDYQDVLRTVSYDDISPNPDTTSRTITFAASDGTLTSNTATSTVTFFPPSATPTLDLNGPALGTDFNTEYIGGGSPVPVEDPNGLVVTEGLNPFLTGATVTLFSVADGSTPSLSADTSGTSIAANYDPSTEVLQLTGNASPADYERVLRTVKYANPNPAEISDDFVDFIVQSGASVSTVAGTDVFILLPKKPPTLDANGAGAGTGFSAIFTAGEGAVPAVDSAALTVGADGTTLASATVHLLNPLDGANESLSVDVVGTPITASYDSATATLTLSGTADVADYQNVLRTLVYNNLAPSPNPAPRTITAVVSDGQLNSSPATLTVAPRGVLVRVGNGVASSARFRESNGSRIAVELSGGGNATLSFIGSTLATSVRGSRLTVAGQSLSLDAITLDQTTAQSILRIDAAGGIGTLGKITGTLPVGALLAPRVNLVGDGIVMTDAGYIRSVRLHGLTNAAGILMPGLSPLVGLLLQLNQADPDSTIDLGSQLDTLRIGGRIVARHRAPGVVFGPAGPPTL